MIKELVDWILSLPDKFKQLLADCVKNFTNSITQIAQNVSSIPEQIANLTNAQAQSIAGQFTQAGQLLLDSVKTQSSSVPSVISSALSMDTNDPQHLSTINNYISQSTPSVNSITDNTTSSKFSSMKSP